MRHDDIRKQYTRHGGLWNDKNKLFTVGDQMQYEWEKDFIAMKWALERIDDFLEVAKKHEYFTGTLHIAKDELLKRISNYSCPSNLKSEYKTKEMCPLKDGCKCLHGVSVNADNEHDLATGPKLGIEKPVFPADRIERGWHK